MIISRTPFRVSLFGGGTDYPAWFCEHGGAVFGTAIDKYCYITVRRLPPFFEHKSRIVYSQVELVNNASEIKHPAVRGILTDWESRTARNSSRRRLAGPLRSGSARSPSAIACPRGPRRKMMSKRDLARGRSATGVP